MMIIGNWKMNGRSASLAEVERLKARLGTVTLPSTVTVGLCPPATLISSLIDVVADAPIAVGGQDCHPASSGAHTGDIAAEMLADLGATMVIVGHSERRADHGETDAMVAAKAKAAQAAGLTAIVCVGETEAERSSGRAIEVVLGQLAGSLPGDLDPIKLTVAYEPVWAIGTGLVPTGDDILEMHQSIGQHLRETFETPGPIPILYGGSVKPDNAADILGLEGVGGALVGGASLKAADFFGIVTSALD